MWVKEDVEYLCKLCFLIFVSLQKLKRMVSISICSWQVELYGYMGPAIKPCQFRIRSRSR